MNTPTPQLLPPRASSVETFLLKTTLPSLQDLGFDDSTGISTMQLEISISQGDIILEPVTYTLDKLGVDYQQHVEFRALTAGLGKVVVSKNRRMYYEMSIIISYTDRNKKPSFFVLDRGTVEILDKGTSDTADNDTDILAELNRIIKAKLEGRDDVLSYKIGDREITTMPLAELEVMRSKYQARIARAANPHRTWYKYRR